jgi:DtxR family Mn-dependent transcriptional regulator
MQPGILLTLGVLFLALLTVLFWPRRGLLAMLATTGRSRLRVQVEDSLKFLFDHEYRNVPCSLNTLAGGLHLSTRRMARIMDHLHDMGLCTTREGQYGLTDTGRSYALRIIRVHRIWEKYLAEESGYGERDWHGQADVQEHLLTPEAADDLASRMGNPLFDPHGDPIPSPGGQMPEYRGKPLSTLKEGEVARIIHIEDEPEVIYEQITALGLYPGMQVYVMDVGDDRIRFAAEGEESVLTQAFASAITVEPLSTYKVNRQKQVTLSSLEPGESAVVTGISPLCRGQQRRRLMDLGVVPGTPVQALLRSASGDPVAYWIMGATIGIRKSQADLVHIENRSPATYEPV